MTNNIRQIWGALECQNSVCVHPFSSGRSQKAAVNVMWFLFLCPLLDICIKLHVISLLQRAHPQHIHTISNTPRRQDGCSFFGHVRWTLLFSPVNDASSTLHESYYFLLARYAVWAKISCLDCAIIWSPQCSTLYSMWCGKCAFNRVLYYAVRVNVPRISVCDPAQMLWLGLLFAS